MKSENDFFFIEKKHLQGKTSFPFQLYIYNPMNSNFSLFLKGNNPLTNNHIEFLEYILERGGKLAILRNQKRTFIISQSIPEDEIESLKTKELHPLEKERTINIKLKEIHEARHGIFSLKNEFKKIIEKDDFNSIIESCRIEILTFPANISPTVSFATHLAKNNLHKDNFVNRVVSLSYYLAKNLNISDELSLSDIVVGAFLSHIGFTQIPLSLARKKVFKMSDKEKLLYKKHTILGFHLVKKSQIKLSDRCRKIILDHHERYTGSGYPSSKISDQMDFLSQIVGIVSHIIEYSQGHITGEPKPLKSIIHALNVKNYQPGLEFDFEESLFQSIITLIDSKYDEISNNNKAA